MNLQELQQIYDYTRRTVAITGGTGTLGSALTAALVGCGANVVLLARNITKAERFAASLQGQTGKTLVMQADVLKRDTLLQADERIRAEFGVVDTLINMAGGVHPDAVTSAENPFFDLDQSAVQFVFDLNSMGTVLPCQVFGKGMVEQDAGIILNISSMGAERPLTRSAPYSAAKAAVSNFTQWLAVHMAQEYSPNIRVNALSPGFFVGEQNRAMLLNADDTLTERGQRIISHTPMGRFGEPQDLVGAMLWLTSPASQFVTGIVVPVDGGFSAYGGV